MLSELAFADDAALANADTTAASERLNNLDAGCKEAGMSISKPKTKVQHIKHKPKVSATTEEDIKNLPPEKKFQFECPIIIIIINTIIGNEVPFDRP